MTLRAVVGDVALSGTFGAGTHRSAPVTTGGAVGFADALVAVHVTAASGTSPTLAVSLEQSTDGATWAAVPGSGSVTLTAVGNTTTYAAVTAPLARVAAAVGGTTPSFTVRVAVVGFGD